jgi:hypothetical protein
VANELWLKGIKPCFLQIIEQKIIAKKYLDSYLIILQKVVVPFGKESSILTPYMEKVREQLSVTCVDRNDITAHMFLGKFPRTV